LNNWFFGGGLLDTLLQFKNIRIDKISKDDQCINLDLKRGEIHTIMGEPGAGKTGIAQFLAGLQIPTYGTIFLNQQPVQIKSPFQSLALGIGVLFENTSFSYIPYLSVKEYLFLWTNLWIISSRKLAKKTRELLDEYEINIDPNRLFINLNQEERRLIALMRIFARDPSIVVLDEPSSNLSEARKQHLFRIIRKYAEKKKGVLYLSNQLEEILQIGDRVTILKNGATVACHPIEYAKRNPQKILGIYFGREEQVDGTSDDEFKDLIDTLLHTTELLTSEYELQDLLNLLVEKITEASKADACSILLFDEASANVVECFRHSRSNLPEVELKEKIVRDVITSGQPLIIHNMEDAELTKMFHQKVEITSLVCMPITVRTKINGAIQVFYSQKKTFSPEDIELLKTFATQVAIAVENTRLLGRSTLLKEAHHRIKNNLQSIISLLILQLQSKSEKSLEAIVWEIIDRIKTIAGVHEILSQDEKSIGLINFRNLVNIIVSNHNEKDNLNGIQVEIDVSDFYVSYKTATSLGLIVNELLSNCFEHAFPNRKNGRIIVSLSHDENDVKLQVADNGIGLNPDTMQDFSKSLGLSLIKTLISRDLRGSLRFETNQGTRVSIIFPKQQINY
jgi:two-component sensor histidine kinase/ABC-type multidrug transport system ATPase subunit